MTTNYEKIKNCSIEEMVEFINTTPGIHACRFCTRQKSDGTICDCEKYIKLWLESEAEDE